MSPFRNRGYLRRGYRIFSFLVTLDLDTLRSFYLFYRVPLVSVIINIRSIFFEAREYKNYAVKNLKAYIYIFNSRTLAKKINHKKVGIFLDISLTFGRRSWHFVPKLVFQAMPSFEGVLVERLGVRVRRITAIFTRRGIDGIRRW